MASVLNKQTKAYLVSVNTPDYPESEWIINPDMSEVVGLAPKYWKIVTTPRTVIVGTDPETLLPVFDQVFDYSVEAMSQEEQDAYDEANPEPVQEVPLALRTLDDGTPAYDRNGLLVSVSTTTLTFALKVANAKKFTVPLAFTGSTYEVDSNKVITKVAVSVQGNAEFSVVLNVNGIEEQRFTITRASYLFDNLSILLNAGDVVSLQIESSKNLSNPVIMVDTATRN